MADTKDMMMFEQALDAVKQSNAAMAKAMAMQEDLIRSTRNNEVALMQQVILALGKAPASAVAAAGAQERQKATPPQPPPMTTRQVGDIPAPDDDDEPKVTPVFSTVPK